MSFRSETPNVCRQTHTDQGLKSNLSLSGHSMNRDGLSDLRAKQAEHLYQHIYTAPLINIAVGAGLVGILWGVTPLGHMLVWFALVILVNLGRMSLAWFYKALLPSTADRFIKVYLTMSAVSGCLWGMSFLLMPTRKKSSTRCSSCLSPGDW